MVSASSKSRCLTSSPKPIALITSLSHITFVSKASASRGSLADTLRKAFDAKARRTHAPRDCPDRAYNVAPRAAHWCPSPKRDPCQCRRTRAAGDSTADCPAAADSRSSHLSPAQQNHPRSRGCLCCTERPKYAHSLRSSVDHPRRPSLPEELSPAEHPPPPGGARRFALRYSGGRAAGVVCPLRLASGLCGHLGAFRRAS